jgi:hypothetical protein
MKKREIKFTSIVFCEIGVDGLIHHDYSWNKEQKLLMHFIDGIMVETFDEKEARVKIKSLIGLKRKQRQPKEKIHPEPISATTQLKLF